MFSAPEVLEPFINASRTVLKQGETLNVNCTVHDVELVFFSWDFPNKDVSGMKTRLFVSSISRERFRMLNHVKMCSHTSLLFHVFKAKVKEQN